MYCYYYIMLSSEQRQCMWLQLLGLTLYRIAGFLCEDFNLAIGLAHNIKIRQVFNVLHFVTCIHFAISYHYKITASSYASSQQAFIIVQILYNIKCDRSTKWVC